VGVLPFDSLDGQRPTSRTTADCVKPKSTRSQVSASLISKRITVLAKGWDKKSAQFYASEGGTAVFPMVFRGGRGHKIF